MKNVMRRIHIGRVLKIAALAIVVVLSLLLVCLYFLPEFVSSHAVQSRIKHSLSTTMKRDVTWSGFAMSWSDGLTLSGLMLGDGVAPLLKTAVEQIVVAPSVGRGVDGRFGINLVVRIRNVRAELAPGPAKPPPPPSGKDPLTLLAESIQRIQRLDYPLPVDLHVMVDVAPLQLSYRIPGRQLLLQDFSFRLAMPSLAAKPVTAEVSGLISVDGRKIGNVSLNAKVSDLVTKERRIHLSSALFAVAAAAPGTSMTLSGGLSQNDGFAAHCTLNLPVLLAVAQPFIPATVPQLEGTIVVLVRAKSDANRDLRATLTLEGGGLASRGGSLKARRVGPINLLLRQQIVTDHGTQRVDFPGGAMAIPGLIDAAWSAKVTHPTEPGRSLDVTFGPLRLDLARAHSLAAPFLPPGTPVKDLAGEVSLRSLSLHLTGPKNNGNLAVAGFGIKLPRVRLALKKGELSAEDVDLLVERAECPLTAALPARLTADLLWSLKRTVLTGAQPLVIQGAHGRLRVAVTDLNLKSASPRKVAASVILTQGVDLDRVALGAQLTVEKVHEQLRVLARAAENGEIEANIPEFAVTAASLQGTAAGKHFVPIPLIASLSVAGFHLPADKGGLPTLQRASAHVAAGDFLQLAAEAALSGASPLRAITSGIARLDLRRAMPFAVPFVPTGLKAGGIVTARWNMTAPLPEKTPAAEKHPLRSARAGLSLFDTLELGVNLDAVSATLPTAKGTITVTGVRTKPDVRVVTTQKGESVGFEGGVLFGGVSGLPGGAGTVPPQHGSFTFNGELSGWRDFRVSEQLRVDPLAVSHEGELTVSRIDALMDEKEPFSTATLIKRLDATLFADVEGVFSRGVKQLLPGFDLAGDISGGVRVDLSAGRELALRCTLKTNDFGVQLANGTKVEGLRSDIAVNQAYALAAPRGESWIPLSTALVRPPPVTRANPGAAEIIGRIHNDLRGDVRGTRSFSIRRVTTQVSGVPLELTALEGDLLFSQKECGLSFFQANLLGGTLLARGVFDLQPVVPAIAAAGSFSHLDISQLLPKETRRLEAGQDAEITGEISLTAPLTPEQRELFEQLRLALNLRKIGPNTIERALFSLDPYERNEQVVSQRKMLRHGRLLGLRATAVDGAFSMEGEAQVKGVAVDLPKVERVRISELPLRQELVKNREAVMALRTLLDLVRADMLVVGPKGELSLKRRIYEQ